LDTEFLYALNLAVTLGMFIVLIYRAHLDSKRTKATIEQAKAAELLRTLRVMLDKEEETIKGMKGEEVYEFLKTLVKE
jgi:hypothetical protein